MKLSTDDVQAIIGQRPAWSLVDRVSETEPGAAIHGYKLVSANDPLLGVDGAGRAAMPSVVLVEALAQLASVLAYVSAPFDTHSKAPYCLGVEQARFLRQARPGERVELRAAVLRHRSNIWKLRGDAQVDGVVILEAELHISVIDRGP